MNSMSSPKSESREKSAASGKHKPALLKLVCKGRASSLLV